MLVSVLALDEFHYKLKLCVNVTWWNDMLSVTVTAVVAIAMVVILLSLRSFLFLCLIAFLNLYHCTVSWMQLQMLKKKLTVHLDYYIHQNVHIVWQLSLKLKRYRCNKAHPIISSLQCRRGRFQYAVIDTKYKQERKKRLHFLSTTEER